MSRNQSNKWFSIGLKFFLAILVGPLGLYFFWRGFETLRPPIAWHLLTKSEYKDWSDCNVSWMTDVLKRWQREKKSLTTLKASEEELVKRCGREPKRYLWER